MRSTFISTAFGKCGQEPDSSIVQSVLVNPVINNPVINNPVINNPGLVLAITDLAPDCRIRQKKRGRPRKTDAEKEESRLYRENLKEMEDGADDGVDKKDDKEKDKEKDKEESISKKMRIAKQPGILSFIKK
jgi:hypothetical protein